MLYFSAVNLAVTVLNSNKQKQFPFCKCSRGRVTVWKITLQHDLKVNKTARSKQSTDCKLQIAIGDKETLVKGFKLLQGKLFPAWYSHTVWCFAYFVRLHSKQWMFCSLQSFCHLCDEIITLSKKNNVNSLWYCWLSSFSLGCADMYGPKVVQKWIQLSINLCPCEI